MIFSEQDRKTLGLIYESLTSVRLDVGMRSQASEGSPFSLHVRLNDLTHMLNELGQAVGRLEATGKRENEAALNILQSWQNKLDALAAQIGFPQCIPTDSNPLGDGNIGDKLNELAERLATIKQEIISESWDEGYEAGLNATTCAKCDKAIAARPARRVNGKRKGKKAA